MLNQLSQFLCNERKRPRLQLSDAKVTNQLPDIEIIYLFKKKCGFLRSNILKFENICAKPAFPASFILPKVCKERTSVEQGEESWG